MAGEALTLADVADLKGGFAFRSEDYAPVGRFVLRTLNIREDGRISRESAVFLPDHLVPTYERFELEPEDTLFVMVGATLGKVGYIKESDLPALLNQNMWVIRSKDHTRTHPRFLNYWFRVKVEETLHWASGSARGFVRRDDYRNLPFPSVPYEAQVEIAETLGALDDKIELNRRMNGTLEALAQAVFKEWFVEKAEEGWEEVSLREACDIHDSKRVPLSNREREQRPGPYPYYGAASVMDYVNDYLFDGVHVLMGEDGSVVNPDGTPVLQYVWGKIWVNNHAHVLTGKGRISTEHLLLALKEVQIAPYVTGAVQMKLNQGNLFKVPFLMPSEKTCKSFNEIITPLYTKLRANVEESRTLTALRDTLLPKLMRGEVRVKSIQPADSITLRDHH